MMLLQGIGDSSQGFANAILFVIFTKTIRDSFLKCICCGKRDNNGNHDANYKGVIQEHSGENSQLIAGFDGNCDESDILAEPIRQNLMAIVTEPIRQNLMELFESEEVSLVLGSLQNDESERSNSGQYGAA